MREISKKVNLLKPIDVENINISRDYYFADAYTIDLPLDSTPDHIWQDIFEREWKTSRYLWDRKLFIVNDKLRLVTTIDNIEDKLDWVKLVVERTNKCVDDYRVEAEARILQMEHEVRREVLEEDELIEKVRDRIRKIVV
jgi:tRNA uridine 5-carbamoylmethylation protein Kti12